MNTKSKRENEEPFTNLRRLVGKEERQEGRKAGRGCDAGQPGVGSAPRGSGSSVPIRPCRRFRLHPGRAAPPTGRAPDRQRTRSRTVSCSFDAAGPGAGWGGSHRMPEGEKAVPVHASASASPASANSASARPTSANSIPANRTREARGRIGRPPQSVVRPADHEHELSPDRVKRCKVRTDFFERSVSDLFEFL